jgi:hypothetical protein
VSDPPDPLIGAVVDGRWRVTARLGQGGMGTVYRGERLKLGKSVALKFLDERCALSKEALARFDREARAISLLQHAHCVSIGDFGVHGGRPFIVMEYVAGRTLGSLMGSKEMTPVRAVSIMRQILDALRHAHAHAVVHRDLKPDNVMLAEVTGVADYVKILDFGLARIITAGEPEISIPALVAGTPSWMSPEQASGLKVDHRTDLFTAGVMLYGMCTGRKPFRAENPAEVLRQIREVQPTPPRKLAPGLSDALERVILKAMAKSRDDRFDTAADFLAALDATPEARSLTRPARKGGGVWRAAFVLALVGAGAGGAFLFHDDLARRIAPPLPPKPRPAAPAPEPEPAPPQVVAPEPNEVPSEAVATAAPDSSRVEIDRLIEAGNFTAAEKALRALVQKEPRTAWTHLALGEIHFRRLWRVDAVQDWDDALRLDPELRHDKRLGDRLCVALGPKWQGGAHLLTSRFAEELIPTLERCLASVDDYPRLQAAAHVLERVAGRAHVDRGLIAMRTLELASGCEDRRTAVRTLARLRDARAAEALERLRSDACLAPVIPPGLSGWRSERAP